MRLSRTGMWISHPGVEVDFLPFVAAISSYFTMTTKKNGDALFGDHRSQQKQTQDLHTKY